MRTVFNLTVIKGWCSLDKKENPLSLAAKQEERLPMDIQLPYQWIYSYHTNGYTITLPMDVHIPYQWIYSYLTNGYTIALPMDTQLHNKWI